MYFPHSPSLRAPSQALFISALIIFSRLSRRDSRNVYVHPNNTAPLRPSVLQTRSSQSLSLQVRQGRLFVTVARANGTKDGH